MLELLNEVMDSESALRYAMTATQIIAMAVHQTECLLKQIGFEMEATPIIVIHALNALRATIRTMQLIRPSALHCEVMDLGLALKFEMMGIQIIMMAVLQTEHLLKLIIFEQAEAILQLIHLRCEAQNILLMFMYEIRYVQMNIK